MLDKIKPLFKFNYENNSYLVYEEDNKIYANLVIIDKDNIIFEEIKDEKVFDLIDEYLCKEDNSNDNA